MKHLLFISHARGIHGAETVMVQAVKACVAKGARVTVVVPSVVPDSGLEAELKKIPHVHILPLPYRAAGVHAWRTCLVGIYNTYALLCLIRYAQREQVDAIYSNSSITILGCLLAKRTGIKHIWHWHESVNARLGWHPSLAGSYRKWRPQADTIIFISHRQQKEWESTLHLPIPNSQIIYNPVKPINVHGSHVIHNGINIGFIGHFEELKNIGMLVHAFEQLHSLYPKTTLLLCGAAGEADKRYIEQMTDLRTPTVEILPQTPDVAAFYNRIDILVLPSWKETMPLVVLEAMQAGICVLQTNQSGMSELLENGTETLFFSPDQPEELERLLMHSMDDEYRESIADAGQKKALQLVKNQSFDQQIQALLCE